MVAWFCSYLAEHYQHIKVNFEVFINTALQCGVPEGSVLRSILFIIYTLQLGQIIIDRYQIAKQHFVDHLDDTPKKLYVLFHLTKKGSFNLVCFG